MTAPLAMYAGASPFGIDQGLRSSVASAVRRFHEVRESAPAVERTAVREANVGTAKTAGPGRMLLKLITAGWSLNGNHYGAEVLKKAAHDRAWGAGTRCYVDHASEQEEEQHPSGSVKNLAAVLTEDARWDETSQSLVAEARLFEPWRGPLSEMAEAGAIGMSIRAWVTGKQGEVDGREGFVVDWVEGRSVDFVTVPAAGGAVISVLEAVGEKPVVEAANLGAWLESRLHLVLTQYADDMYGDGRLTRAERIVLSNAIGDGLSAYTSRIEADAPQLYKRSRWSDPETADTAEARSANEASTEDTRSLLSTALRDTYGGKDTYVWVRDFDPDRNLVWFEVSGPSESTLWQQAYTADGDVDGDRVEVRARTVYDPVATESAESATPIQAAPAVDEDVTDGAPPPPPATPEIEEEPVSGSQTGAPPEQAGTATVPDNAAPAATTTESAAPSQEAFAAMVAAAVAEATRPLTTQIADLTAANAARAEADRADRNRHAAVEAVTAALRAADVADVAASITPRVTARVTAAVPTTSEGAVDDARLGELITTVVADEAEFVRRERANALADAGVGLPYGMGGGAPAEESVNDGLEDNLKNLFENLGMPSDAAGIAAKGRVR